MEKTEERRSVLCISFSLHVREEAFEEEGGMEGHFQRGGLLLLPHSRGHTPASIDCTEIESDETRQTVRANKVTRGGAW